MIDPIRAARFLSSIKFLTKRYAEKMNHSITVVVNFGSHVHHTPQTGFAHKAPVTIISDAKIIPVWANENARSSQ